MGRARGCGIARARNEGVKHPLLRWWNILVHVTGSMAHARPAVCSPAFSDAAPGDDYSGREMQMKKSIHMRYRKVDMSVLPFLWAVTLGVGAARPLSPTRVGPVRCDQALARRRFWKNSLKTCPHSLASTPSTTSTFQLFWACLSTS